MYLAHFMGSFIEVQTSRIGHLLFEIPIILVISGAITGIFAATGQFFNLGLVVCAIT